MRVKSACARGWVKLGAFHAAGGGAVGAAVVTGRAVGGSDSKELDERLKRKVDERR